MIIRARLLPVRNAPASGPPISVKLSTKRVLLYVASNKIDTVSRQAFLHENDVLNIILHLVMADPRSHFTGKLEVCKLRSNSLFTTAGRFVHGGTTELWEHRRN